MKNKVVMFFGVFVFLIGFVCAAESSTETEFNIHGCNFDFEGVNVGISAGECSSGVSEGHFFCGDDTTEYITTITPRGCSLGLASYTNGTDYCCPSGMYCDEGSLVCVLRANNCVDQDNVNDCENNGCIWLDVTGECVENPRDEDCSYYDTQARCDADKWNLGSDGVGTDMCGETIECAGKIFSISEDSCGCHWNDSAPAGDKCHLKMNATEMFYSGDPDKFSCSNIYDLGLCVDGVQNVSWFSTSDVKSGFTDLDGDGTPDIPAECLTVMGCDGGEGERFCGEPIITLPGVSLFSLFASLLIIGFYYMFSGRFKYKKGVEIL